MDGEQPEEGGGFRGKALRFGLRQETASHSRLKLPQTTIVDDEDLEHLDKRLKLSRALPESSSLLERHQGESAAGASAATLGFVLSP